MHTLTDIAGADAAVALGNPAGAKASWVQIIVTGAGTVRFGDTTTDSSHGLPIDAGGGMLLPWRGPLNWYAMDALRVYVPTGASVSVAYAS